MCSVLRAASGHVLDAQRESGGIGVVFEIAAAAAARFDMVAGTKSEVIRLLAAYQRKKCVFAGVQRS
jgi:hypothetical protein